MYPGIWNQLGVRRLGVGIIKASNISLIYTMLSHLRLLPQLTIPFFYFNFVATITATYYPFLLFQLCWVMRYVFPSRFFKDLLSYFLATLYMYL